MKIAIIGVRGYPSHYGGYESFVKELAERLVEKKEVDVTVYCHKGLFQNRPKQIKGINLVYIPAIETKTLSQLTHSLFSILHASFRSYDLMFVVNSANGPLGFLPRAFGRRTVINVDGLEWLRPKWKGLGAKYFHFAAKMSTKLYDEIVCDADEMRRVYLDLFNRDSTVIAYGAPKMLNTDSTELITKRGLIKGEYYLIIGRLIPDNNSRLIAEGFLASKSKKKLVIVGGVPYKDRYVQSITELAKTDDRLVVTGHIDDRNEVAELFQNAYMYVHGHEFGGTNPTMIEALGYGCAILALDTPFNQEMLQQGRFGVFFQKDINNIIDQFEYWDGALDTVRRMKEEAPAGVIDRYKWDVVTHQYYELFKRVISLK